MKGLYLYCLRVHGANSGKRKMKGIDSGEEIRAVPFKDIEALASEIDLSRFNEKKIKNQLQEDPKWTEKNIRCHHNVIAEAYKNSAVIPMKFGTIFKTKKSLAEMLKSNYGKFKKLLADLNDKQEWGVKGYLEYKKFVQILKNKDKEIRKLEKKRSSIPEGMKWYVDRKSDELIAGQLEHEVEKELQKIVDKLEKHTEGIRLNDLLPKEVGESGKDIILNTACLVRNDRLDAFQSLLQELAKEYDAVGITLFLTGPWPPYNFVELKR